MFVKSPGRNSNQPMIANKPLIRTSGARAAEAVRLSELGQSRALGHPYQAIERIRPVLRYDISLLETMTRGSHKTLTVNR